MPNTNVFKRNTDDPQKYQRVIIVTFDDENEPECVFDYTKARVKQEISGDYQSEITIESDLLAEDSALWFFTVFRKTELRKKLKKFLKLWEESKS